MDNLSSLKLDVSKAMPTSDKSFDVTLHFDNVQGTYSTVDAINAAIDAVKCPSGFNGLQLALTTANLANTIYSAIKKNRSLF